MKKRIMALFLIFMICAVSPAPDTLIRVFMAYKPSANYVEMEAQELTASERTGFTVVEWGGTEIN